MVLRLSGPWTLATLLAVDADLRATAERQADAVTIDAAAVTSREALAALPVTRKSELLARHLSAHSVGGDPFGSQPAFYCVAFQHALTHGSGSSEIGYALVNTAGIVTLGPTYLSGGPDPRDRAPSLSKSNGFMVPKKSCSF